MNGITHFLVGIIITLFVWHIFSDEWAEERPWACKEAFTIHNIPIRPVSIIRVSLTCLGAFFSHILVDGFGGFTYHGVTNWNDPFYAVWTPILIIAAGLVAAIAIKKDARFAWGILFSVAFDLWDWNTLRTIG